MDDRDALEQLRDDILEVFPPGNERDVWLAWLLLLESDALWRETGSPSIDDLLEPDLPGPFACGKDAAEYYLKKLDAHRAAKRRAH